MWTAGVCTHSLSANTATASLQHGASATVSGVPINTFCEMRGHFNHDEATERIAENVKNSAYEIIAKKKATYFELQWQCAESARRSSATKNPFYRYRI